MQQALPYKTWHQISTKKTPCNNNNTTKTVSQTTCVKQIISENPIIVFSRPGCCMSHVVKRLLLGLGVNPTVYDVEEHEESRVVDLFRMNKCDGDHVDEYLEQFPVVFIGGKLFGGLDRVMATHITGDLVPLLKRAGALWL